MKRHAWAPKAPFSQPHINLFTPSDPICRHRPDHACTLPPASKWSWAKRNPTSLKNLDRLLPPPGRPLWAPQLEVTFSPLRCHISPMNITCIYTKFQEGSNGFALTSAERVLLNKHQAWCEPPELQKWQKHSPYPRGSHTLSRGDGDVIYTHYDMKHAL